MQAIIKSYPIMLKEKQEVALPYKSVPLSVSYHNKKVYLSVVVPQFTQGKEMFGIFIVKDNRTASYPAGSIALQSLWINNVLYHLFYYNYDKYNVTSSPFLTPDADA